MLDTRTSALLETINELCGEGGFKIAEEGELLSCFPVSFHVDAAELKRILDYLAERRMIEIKYAEGGVYCLCPLPEGRLYFENVRETRREGARRRREIVFLTAIGAFFGALLGALLAVLPVLLTR